VLRELLDGVAAVAQDAIVAVDVGDRAFARGGVHEAGVNGDEAGVAHERGDRDAVVSYRRALDREFTGVAIHHESSIDNSAHVSSLRGGRSFPSVYLELVRR